MERLTQQYFSMCEHCSEGTVCEHYCDPSFPVCGNKAIYDRLASYEDTGLEPEGIAAAQKAMRAALGLACEVQSFRNLGQFDHLQELARAEKDGRLVVLPCKVGAPVYRVGAGICKWREIDRCNEYCSGYEYEDCWEGGKEVLEEKFCLEMLDKVGKTVFLIRQEAEAALKGGNENA